MSHFSDTEGIGREPRPPPDAERKRLVAERRLRECSEVNRLTSERVGVEEIAKRLGFTQHKVQVLQWWLGWRRSDLKWWLRQDWQTLVGPSHGELHGAGVERWPSSDSSSRRLDATSETEHENG